MTNPIPVSGVPSKVTPNAQMQIPLFWDHQEGINWNRGQPVSSSQLEQAIDRSRGLNLPNDLLPALDPGDVVVLTDGVFWIDESWILRRMAGDS